MSTKERAEVNSHKLNNTKSANDTINSVKVETSSTCNIWLNDLKVIYGKYGKEIYIAQRMEPTTEIEDFKNRLNGQQLNLHVLDADSEVVLQRFEMIEIENLEQDRSQSTLRQKYFAEIDSKLADEYIRVLDHLSDLDIKRLADGEIIPFLQSEM